MLVFLIVVVLMVLQVATIGVVFTIAAKIYAKPKDRVRGTKVSVKEIKPKKRGLFAKKEAPPKEEDKEESFTIFG